MTAYQTKPDTSAAATSELKQTAQRGLSGDSLDNITGPESRFIVLGSFKFHNW